MSSCTKYPDLQFTQVDRSNRNVLLDLNERSHCVSPGGVSITSEWLDFWLASSRAEIELVWQGSSPVAFSRAVKYSNDIVPLMLVHVCVDPPFRRSGIGTRTIRRAMQRANLQGFTAMDAIVDMSNHGSASFLRKHRFDCLVDTVKLQASLSRSMHESTLTTGFHIRGYRPGLDTGLITSLYNEVFQDSLAFSRMTVGEVSEIERGILFDAELIAFAENESGEVAGFVRAVHRPSDDCARIELLGVLPRWRRAGIGSQLLCHEFRLLAAKGISRLHLTVENQNTAARALYQTFGFGPVAWERRYRRKLAY